MAGTSPLQNVNPQFSAHNELTLSSEESHDEVTGRHHAPTHRLGIHSPTLSPKNSALEGGGGGGGGDLADSFHFEGLHFSVSELDGAAYGKIPSSVTLEKNVMNRMFKAFDMQHQGFLESEGLEQLMAYLGRPLGRSASPTPSLGASPESSNVDEVKLDALRSRKSLTFEEFWVWWQDFESSEHAFEMVSFDFSVPFHQQQLQIFESGEKYTPNYRVNFQFKDIETAEVRSVSPWHDIPLEVRDIVRTIPEKEHNNMYNFICEIPKWTRAKFEICTKEPFNPIKQDMKNGVPRFYQHGDMMWNYGAFPQTWESTALTFVDGVKGDNDPVDAIEIGMVQLKTGAVTAVKVLGILGMIDDGEMDWKVICISVQDPVAKFLQDIHDVPKYLPGCLDAIREWLRTYKICQGGKENTFAFDGDYKDQKYAITVLEESHRMWANLKKINRTDRV